MAKYDEDRNLTTIVVSSNVNLGVHKYSSVNVDTTMSSTGSDNGLQAAQEVTTFGGASIADRNDESTNNTSSDDSNDSASGSNAISFSPLVLAFYELMQYFRYGVIPERFKSSQDIEDDVSIDNTVDKKEPSLEGTAADKAQGALVEGESPEEAVETDKAVSDKPSPPPVEAVQNTRPTDILLSQNSLSEAMTSGQEVISLSAIDKGDMAPGSQKFELLGDSSNAFVLKGNKIFLKDDALLDFEQQSSIVITLKVTDSMGLSFKKTFQLSVTDNPEDVQLSDNGSIFVDVGQAETSITGSVGDDTITAHTTQGSKILAGAGNDTINLGKGKDIVDGGAGTDTLVLDGNWRDYTISESGGVYSIFHKTEDSGRDIVSNVEVFQFADRTLSLDALINTAPTGLTMNQTSFQENSTGVLANFSVTDLNDPNQTDTYTYTLLDDAGGLFYLDGSELRITEGRELDYEKKDSDQITVIVRDSSGQRFAKTFSVSIEDVAENITLENTTLYREEGIAEKSVTGTSRSDTFYGSDGNDTFDGGEGNDTFYQSAGNDIIIGGAGRDNLIINGKWADYDITETGGVFKLASRVDSTVYDLVQGVEKFNFTDKTVSVDNLLDSAPTDILADGLVIDENSEIGSVVATLRSIDPNDQAGKDQYTYTLTGNNNQAFKIVDNQLIVADRSKLDFEASSTQNVSIRVTDAGGNSYIKNFIIQLNDIAEDIVLADTGVLFTDTNTQELSITGGSGNDTLAGGFGDDIIYGGDGDDAIAGKEGNDTIYGDDGVDVIHSGSGDDTIFGGTGDDRIYTNEGNDTVDGGEGNDIIYGQEGNDTIDGGAGNDTIDGGFGDDVIYGGDGDDAIAGKEGNDTIYGDDGVDVIHSGSGDDTIFGGTGDDRIYTNEGNDTVDGGEGNDIIYGQEGNDTIDGGAGNDTIDGGFGDDIIYGGDGDDAIAGKEGNDTIYGDDGVDVIHSGSGGDTIFGGTGDDRIYANEGNDTVDGGEGNDIIYGQEGNDTIDGGDGNDTAVFAGNYADYAISYDDTSATFTLVGPGGETDTVTQVENFAFNDQTLSATALQGAADQQISGSAGNDTLTGGTGDDTLSGGSGDDSIDGGAGNDTAVFAGDYADYAISYDDTSATFTLVGPGGETDTVTQVENFAFDDQTLSATALQGAADQQISGSAGNDTLTGGTGDDTLSGGSGDDSINGGAGNDTAVFAGDYADYAISYDDTSATFTLVGPGGETDTVTQVENFAFNDQTLSATALQGAADQQISGSAGNDTLTGGSGDDILAGGTGDDSIDGGAGNDTAVFAGDYADYAISYDDTSATFTLVGPGGETDTVTQVESFAFNDQTLSATALQGAADQQVSGSAGNDTLTGGSGNDTLAGGTGDDSIDGGAGNDTAVFAGDYADYAISYDDTSATFTLVGPGGETDTVTQVESFAFNDQTLSATALQGAADQQISGSAGNDTLTGGSGDDTLAGGSGDDSIDGGAGNDTAVFAGDYADYAISYDDTSATFTLVGPGGETDTVTQVESFAFNDQTLSATALQGAADQQVSGGTGNDTLTGGSGDDTIYGGSGDDTIDGGDGNDTAVFAGDYADYAISYDDTSATFTLVGPGGETDTVTQVESFAFNDQTLSATALQGAADQQISGSAGNDTLTGGSGDDTLAGGTGDDSIDGGAGNDTIYAGDDHDTVYGGTGDDTIYGEAGNDTINGGDGDDLIYGGTGDDIIDGGIGNDLIYGGTGNDTISGGDGSDTIYGKLGDDSIDGGAGDDMLFGNDGNDSIAGGAGNDTIYGNDGNDILNGGLGNDKIYGGNGNDVINGEDGDDTIYGEAGNDTINGADGDDLIYGGSGNDTLTGGSGNDTLAGGSGDDSIDGGAGNDTAVFAGDYADYAISYDDTSATFTLVGPGGETDTVTQVESFAFNDQTLSATALQGAADQQISGSAGNDTLTGGSGDDTIDGGAGNDTAVFAGDYADYAISYDDTSATFTLVGPGGETDTVTQVESFAFNDQTLSATALQGAADQQISGSAGNDTLTGGSGDDTLTGGAGDDSIDGGAGNDTAVFAGDAGNYSYFHNTYTNTYTVIGPDGTDTITNVENFAFADQTVAAADLGAHLTQLDTTIGLSAGSLSGVETVRGESRVDSGNGTNVSDAVTTVLADGSYVVAWEAGNQDGDGRGIFAQRYSADGTPAGSELQVNTYTSNDQSSPAITALANGGFVVSWDSDGQDNSFTGMYAQRYDANAMPDGNEFQVNTYTQGSQNRGDVTALADGGFIVTWDSNWQEEQQEGAGIQAGSGIYGQRYGADGSPIGEEFHINTYTDNNQIMPVTTGLSDGGFIISWVSWEQDGDGWGIFAQRYSADGVPNGEEFQVNTYSDGLQHLPSIVELPDGGLIITWTSGGNQDGSYSGIFGQRYNADGTLNGSEFQVNTYVQNSQLFSKVSLLDNGGFVITWASQNHEGDGDTGGWGVYGQRYSANGSKVGDEFSINNTKFEDYQEADISVLADGNLLVVWQDGDNGVMQKTIAFDDSNHVVENDAGALIGTLNVDYLSGDGSYTFGISDNRFEVVDNNGSYELRLKADEYLDYETDTDSLDVSVTVTAGGSGESVTQDVTINIADSTGQTYLGSAGDDTLTAGSDDDVIQGFEGNDTLTGGSGDDTLAGGTGDDSIDGGDGNDTAVFAGDAGNYSYFHNTHTNTYTITGPDGTDTVRNVESFAFDDQTVAAADLGAHLTQLDTTIGLSTGSLSGVETVRGESRVDSGNGTNVSDAVTTVLADGSYVVTWTSNGQDGDGRGIFAQQYSSDGTPAGSEFQVNTYTSNDQSSPAITALANDGFVISWSSFGQDGNDQGVFAQRYGASAMPEGSEFQVNTNTTHWQHKPDLTAFSDGSFIITWMSHGNQDGSGWGIFAQRYGVDGEPDGVEFQVNTHTDSAQNEPAITTLADGGFVVTWTSDAQDGSQNGVYGQRYDADGIPAGSEFMINTETASHQDSAEITALSDGGFIVTWASWGQDGSKRGVYGQRYDADGMPSGGEFAVNTHTLNYQWGSTVTGLPDGGFVITWESNGQDSSEYGLYGQRFDEDGSPMGDEFRINDTILGNQQKPDINVLADGNLLVVWQDSDNGIVQKTIAFDDSNHVVENDAGALIGTLNVDYLSGDGSYTFGVSDNRFEVVDNNGSYELRLKANEYLDYETDTDSLDVSVTVTAGGSGESVTQDVTINIADSTGQTHYGTAGNDTLVGGDYDETDVFYGGAGDDTIDGGAGNDIAAFNDGTAEYSYFHNTYTDTYTIIGPDGTDTVRNVESFAFGDQTVAAADLGAHLTQLDTTIGLSTGSVSGVETVRSESRVDSGNGTNVSQAVTTVLADGSYVVAWEAGSQDGDGRGIFAQRYSADGTPAGSEFQVNTYTAEWQRTPTITTLADGDFVIAWRSNGQDGTLGSIHAQRYGADGLPAGGEFQVDTPMNDWQTYPDITSLSNGGFVVTWKSANQDGDGDGIFAQRYGADGLPAGGEFQVNTYTIGTQAAPEAAGLSDGAFIITWASNDNDGDGTGVFAQRYNADGTPNGTEFQVNTTVIGNQHAPDIIPLSDGGFVITWQSRDDHDGSGAGIFAQRYNADGSTAGSEFQVNTYTLNHQKNPKIEPLSDDGFVITWQSYGQDGKGYSTYGQRYGADGTAVGDEFHVNNNVLEDVLEDQQIPDISVLADGNLLVVWQDGDNGIVQKTIAFDDSNHVVENDAGALIGTLNVDYLSGDGSYTFGISDNRFEVVDNNGSYELRLKADEYLDYETDTDSLDVSVTVTAGGSGESVTQDVTINIADSTGQTYLGSAGDDTLTAGSDDDVIQGFEGNDTLTGGSGDDILTGGSGDDSIDGGAGNDTAVFAGDASNYSYFHNTHTNTYTITGPDGTDTITNVESFAFGDQTVAVADLGAHLTQLDTTIGLSAGSLSGVETVRGESRVDSGNGVDAEHPVTAVLADGSYVVTWSAAGQDANAYGIFAQRYSADGTPAGSEFQVNTNDSSWERSPDITALPDGNFVIVWRGAPNGSSYDIAGQRYEADGTPVGSEFVVNTYTDDIQDNPSVTSLSDGGFVVTWSSQDQDGDGYGVYGQLYNPDGSEKGSEFQINTYTQNDQSDSTVTSLSNGGFIVTWYSEGQDSDDRGVFAQRYGADGLPAGDEFQVNTTTDGAEHLPAVSELSDGSFVIVWRGGYDEASRSGIFAQRYNADGTVSGEEFEVTTYDTLTQFNSSIVSLSDGGFVITWDSKHQDGSGYGIYGQRYGADGTAIGDEFRINDTLVGDQVNPDISVLADGNLLVVWDDSTNGIMQKTIAFDDSNHVVENDAGAFIGTLNVDYLSGDGSYTFGISDNRFEVVDNNGSYELRLKADEYLDYETDTDSLDVSVTVTGGGSGESVIQDVTINIADSTGQTYLGSAGDDGILGGSDDDVIQGYEGNDTLIGGSGDDTIYGGSGDDTIDGGDGNDTAVFAGDAGNYSYFHNTHTNTYTITGPDGTDTVRNVESFAFGDQTVAVADLGAHLTQLDTTIGLSAGSLSGVETVRGESRVDSGNGTNVSDAVTTVLADGSYVVTWSADGQDGDGRGIFAQQYSSDGTPAGSEFQVNTYTANWQIGSVITALADGGFVIGWRSDSQDGSGGGVFAQRYDPDGIPAGNEFQVNTYTLGWQSLPDVTSLSNGEFIFTWNSDGQDGDDAGIFAQRYSADGSPIGAEFQVNTYTESAQHGSTVTALSNGGFIIAWNSIGQDSSSGGIYAQRYNVDGTPNGTEFQVNTWTESLQYMPDITELSNGEFVVSWVSFGQESSFPAIYAQRYNADGTLAGSEFQVNTYAVDYQTIPVVTALPDGEFVITWTSNDQDGSGNGIYGQRYGADGTPIGLEFRINDTLDRNQQIADISVLKNGNLLVVWDDDTNGITQKTIAFDDSNHVVENDAGALIGRLNVDYLSGDGSYTFGVSDNRFEVVDNNGSYELRLKADEYLDYETDTDSLDVSVTVTAGGSGESVTQDVTINIADSTGQTYLGSAGDDGILGGSDDDVIQGYEGNDTLIGGSGDDTIYGGSGDDTIDGGEGSDTFMYDYGDGHDTISGGAGASWTDTIDISSANDTFVSSTGTTYATTDWTATITSGSITSTDSNGITLSQDADGYIDFGDGGRIDFNDIEQIRWD